jgi:hypothetical protein
VKFSSSLVPVNTVLACTVVAMVGRRVFGLLTGMTRMSERPQLGMSGRILSTVHRPDNPQEEACQASP